MRDDGSRQFVTGLAAVLVAPLAIWAQQVGKVPKVGFLGNPPFNHAFEQGLRSLGYTDGQNIAIEYMPWELGNEQLRAAELVRRKVDILVAGTTYGALAAQTATTTIPIVMVNVTDPVATGLVASLARPGGNVTGLSRVTLDLVGKNLELLTEAVPGVVRLAVLSNPRHPLHAALLNGAKHAAESPRLELKPVGAGAPIPVGVGALAFAWSSLCRR